MIHIEGEIVINRPAEVVFDFVADERNEPRGVFKLLRPLIARLGRRQEETIWASLKRFLDEREASPKHA